MAKWKTTITGKHIVKQCIRSAPDIRDEPRTRAAKHNTSTAAQKAMNYKNAVQRLMWLLDCNFKGNDYFLTLTYDKESYPATREQAKRDIRKFNDQIRQFRKPRGQVFKYIYVTEGKHGEKRIHHHMVMNSESKEDFELIRSLWNYGNIDIEQIKDSYFETNGNYINSEKLAKYLCKEKDENRPNGAQAWTASRNLEKPNIRTDRVSDEETIETPIGAFEIERQEIKNIYSTFRYIMYVKPQIQQQRENRTARKNEFEAEQAAKIIGKSRAHMRN